MFQCHSGDRKLVLQMMKVFIILKFCVFVPVTTGELIFPKPQNKATISNYFPFRKIVVDSTGENIYIGGRNGILHLDSELSLVDILVTGPQRDDPQNCLYMDIKTAESQGECSADKLKETDNFNQLLLLDESNRKLISCGTVFQGSCYLINALNFTEKYFKDHSRVACINKDGSTVGLVSPVTFKERRVINLLLVAATYAQKKAIGSTADKYFMFSAHSLNDLRVFEDQGQTVKRYQITLKSDEVMKKYIFQFKNIFKIKRFVYLLARVSVIQKPSRIIKLCTDGGENYDRNNYEDIPIVCESSGKTYQWIQSSAVVDISGEKVLVASFTDSPDKGSNTVVCSFTINNTLDAFIKNRLDLIRKTCSTGKSISSYMKDNLRKGCCNTMTDCENDVSEREFCNQNSYGENMVMDTFPLNGTAVLTLPGDYPYIGGGHIINGFTEIYVGSSSGNVRKFHMTSPEKLVGKEKVVKTMDSTVLNVIAHGSEDLLLLTENKVEKIKPQNCSVAISCTACMELNSAKCGWCIVSQSCTERNHQCQTTEGNLWLSSAEGQCLSVQFKPPGIDLGDGVTETKEIDVEFTPKLNTTAVTGNWACVYENIPKKGSAKNVSAPLSSNGKCKFTTRNQKEGLLTVWIKYKELHIAEGSFLFYTCNLFNTSCFQCKKDKAACYWCPHEAQCKSKSTACKNVTSAVAEKDSCPQMRYTKSQKVPNAEAEDIILKGRNLVEEDGDGSYKCEVDGNEFEATVNVSSQEIRCKNVKVSFSGDSKLEEHEVTVKYKNTFVDIRDVVEVYKCQYLAGSSCSICHHYNLTENYRCNWCNNQCQFSGKPCNGNTAQKCGRPEITKVVPENGPLAGNTLITITGKELGTMQSDINGISVAGVNCTNVNYTVSDQKITCRTGESSVEERGPVYVLVGGLESNKDIEFEYVKPKITSIGPNRGILAGGTRVTIAGKNLYVGNKNMITVALKNDRQQKTTCKIDEKTTNIDNIFCNTEEFKAVVNMTQLQVLYQKEELQMEHIFTYVENPVILSMGPKNVMKRGGISFTVKGKGFLATTQCYITRNNQPSACEKKNDTVIIATIPGKVIRQKRSVSEQRQDFVLQLDGFEETFFVIYVEDPSFSKWNDKKELERNDENVAHLVIRGENFLLGARISDFSITLIERSGDQRDCEIIGIFNSNLTCKVVINTAGEYTVKVKIGRFYSVEIGKVEFSESSLTYIIIGVVSGAAIIIIVLIVIAWRWSIRKKNFEIDKMKMDVESMELTIKNRSREEFADMQISMKDIKGDLVSTGIPYHTYQDYTMHLLFSAADERKKFFQHENEPPDEIHRKKAPAGLLEFEALLFNKYFMLSVIKTLERQNKFSRQEQAQFSSALSVVMLGKMRYFYEVVELLLDNKISSASKKQQKTLFRRFDTISLRLLSNWLSLALYSYLKDGGGDQLFMLYKATQTVMDKNPVDAVTFDAKDTLAEERLLKIDVSGYKQLCLDIDLNGKGHIYKCHVLECDTITQTKAKCLHQIFKNKPVTDLFGVDELKLEWRSGARGHLTLSDIDSTSVRKDGYVKQNTLKHYNVQNDSHLALLVDGDSDEDDDEDDGTPDYENDMKKFKKLDKKENGISSSQVNLLVPNSNHTEQEIPWHLVPPENDGNLPDELFLNRLLHTKLKLHDYIKDVFNNVLDVQRIPPVVHYLFSKLDSLGKSNGAEQDVLNCWRNEVYAIRIWANWISQPESLFDIHRAEHVMPCLDVVKQVFVDVFTQTTCKLTQDSSSQKLLFANDVPRFQEDVNRFYRELASKETVTAEQFCNCLQTLSKTQADIRARKLNALALLYPTVGKYVDEIISDLDEDANTKGLDLGKKLDSVARQMDQLKSTK